MAEIMYSTTNIIVCLILTIWVASLTLLERKLLSLVQKRIGPDMVGYHGRLQFMADAIKLLVKGILIPLNVLKLEISLLPIISIFIVYTFWVNIYLGSNLLLIDLEYNIVYAIIISCLFGYSVLSVGLLSKNKYTMLAGMRFVLVILNNELLLGYLWIFLTLFLESLSFSYIEVFQYKNLFIFSFGPILIVFIVCFFIEIGRTPFDFGESESELVSGYTTELSGFLFVLYYLGEYFHLLVFSSIYSICMFGLIYCFCLIIVFYILFYNLFLFIFYFWFSWLHQYIYT